MTNYQYGDTVRITKGFNMGSERIPHSTTGMVGEVVDPTLYGFHEQPITSTGNKWLAILLDGMSNPLFHLDCNVERVENS